MRKIDVVSWDVYGTLISSEDDKTSDVMGLKLRTRPRALETLTEIKSRGIIQCTCSDGHLLDLKFNLKSVGINWQDFFDDLYKMEPLTQKDFSYIIEFYNIKPEKLLVVGNNFDLDLYLAEKQGCCVFHVPEIEYVNTPLDVRDILELL
jgi:FMN phosphatase YigB (HAD superfamily)